MTILSLMLILTGADSADAHAADGGVDDADSDDDGVGDCDCGDDGYDDCGGISCSYWHK